jgi:enoyl-CoA hydratase/carnithine racemase
MAQLVVTQHGRVSVLTLTRPDAGNRITQIMADELTAALTTARHDKATAGCVLTGHGNVFCLGGDYLSAGPSAAARLQFGQSHIDLVDAAALLGKPLIAAVNGDAHAGGFSLVAACDMAFVAEEATLGLPERANGLFPFLALAIARDTLPKKVLFEIIYHARLLRAEEACALHLANAVVTCATVLPRAIEAVERAADGDPDILRLGRDLYYTMRGLSPSDALDQSRLALVAALAAREQHRERDG